MNLAEKLSTSVDNDDPPHKQVSYKKTKLAAVGLALNANTTNIA